MSKLRLPAFVGACFVVALAVATVQSGDGSFGRHYHDLAAVQQAGGVGESAASTSAPSRGDAITARAFSRVDERIVSPAEYYASVQQAHDAAREEFDAEVFAADDKPAKARLERGAATSRIFTEQMDSLQPPPDAREAHESYRDAAHQLRVLFSHIYHDIDWQASFEDLQDIVYEDDSRLAVFDQLGDAACELERVAREDGHQLDLDCDEA